MKYDHSAFEASAAYGRDCDSRIRQFMPLVRKLAWLYESRSNATVDVDDLMQVGLIALTECVQRHKRDSDDGFAAYVKMRVRGAMIDQLRAQSARPRSAAAFERKCEAAIEGFRMAVGREPSVAELATRLNMTVSELERQQTQGAYRSVSIDDTYSDQDAAFADERPDAEALLLDGEDRERLASAIAALPERLQLIVTLHFVEELNLTEIAAVLDVSVPRVHQLKNAALTKLRLAILSAD